MIPQPDEFYRYRHGVVMATTQMPGTDDDAQSTGRVRVRQRMRRGQEEVERGTFRVGHEMESLMRKFLMKINELFKIKMFLMMLGSCIKFLLM